MTRRQFLKYVTAAAAGTALAGAVGYEALSRISGGNPSSSQSTTSYQPPSTATPDYAEFLTWLSSVSKPFAGRTQNISLEYEFVPLALQKIDPDFFNASGINNQYDLKPYSLHLSDISLMTRTKAPTYDVYTVDYQDVGSFKDYIISPTELAAKYPDLTYQKINPGDYWPVPWSYLATYPPAPFQTSGAPTDVLFVPLDTATIVQYYRKDVYLSAGLSPAKTWTEYVSDAEKFKGSSAGFGTVNQAAPDISIVFEFLNFLSSHGGRLWEVNGGNITTGLGSDSALAALETYVSLQPFSNPASYTFSWPDVATSLLRGTGAAALQFEGYAPWMDDSARSRVVSQIDFAPNPAGSAGSFSTFGGSGVAVSRFSKHPEIAWLWLQWAIALGTQEATLLDYFHAFPSRKAVLDSSSVAHALSDNSYRAVNVTKKVWDSGAVATLLPFPKWFDVLDPISFYLNQAWEGHATPKDALAMAIQKIESWGTLSF